MAIVQAILHAFVLSWAHTRAQCRQPHAPGALLAVRATEHGCGVSSSELCRHLPFTRVPCCTPGDERAVRHVWPADEPPLYPEEAEVAALRQT